jgi:hypothetical protein
MEKISFYINKYKLIIFAIFSVSLAIGISNSCASGLSSNAFDNQELLIWRYSVLHNIFPNRDIFYPYGLINYYKGLNLLFYVLYSSVFPLVIVSIYLLINKLVKSVQFSVIAILLLLTFIVKIVGLNNFDRYSVFYVVPLITAFLIYEKRLISNKASLILGLALGIVVSIFFDQGIYSVFVFYITIIFNNLLLNGKSKKALTEIFRQTLFSGLGLILGLIPLLLFVYTNNALSSFLSFYVYLKELAIIAKTPFFVFFFAPFNLFVFSVIAVSIVYLIIQILFSNKKERLSLLLIFSLILEAIILENKSIFRSLTMQVVFPCTLILLIILYDYFYNLKLNINVKINNKLIVSIIFLLFILTVFLNIDRKFRINLISPNVCLNHNLQELFTKNKQYSEVKRYLGNTNNNAIFSYPGDPMFYVIFKQKIPYYNTIYEASSLTSQDKLINYIKENKVNYVIINSKNTVIQDGVPNYIRGSKLFAYILNNFEYRNQIGEFLILKKERDPDNLTVINNYFRNLLSVELENIPRSEGKYKSKYLDIGKALINEKNNIEINKYLLKNITYSKKLLLVLKGKFKTTEYSEIFIKVNKELTTTIRFKSCQLGEICIIDLSQLPIFYKNRIISVINFDKEYELSILKNSNPNKFW